LLFRLPALALACVFSAGCDRAGEKPAPAARGGPPLRVVTLAPNLTEIVFAVGAGASLVGVSEYSDFPPEAQAIARVGGLEVSAEKVVSLRPDLVLAMEEGSVKCPVSALAAAGVAVLPVPSGSLDAVIAGIRLVGAASVIPPPGIARRGPREAAGRRARAVALPRRTRPKTVILIWPDPPQAAGGGTFLSDLLTEAGGDNLLGARAGWPLVSPEWLATAPMDVLIVPDSAPTRAPTIAPSGKARSRGSAAAARIVRVEESVLTRPGRVSSTRWSAWPGARAMIGGRRKGIRPPSCCSLSASPSAWRSGRSSLLSRSLVGAGQEARPPASSRRCAFRAWRWPRSWAAASRPRARLSRRCSRIRSRTLLLGTSGSGDRAALAALAGLSPLLSPAAAFAGAVLASFGVAALARGAGGSTCSACSSRADRERLLLGPPSSRLLGRLRRSRADDALLDDGSLSTRRRERRPRCFPTPPQRGRSCFSRLRG
jgi:iron complex transport system substrate-binding protein